MSARKIFEDSVVPIPDTKEIVHNGMMLRAAGPDHSKDELNLLFSIETDKALIENLEDKVAKGEVLSPEQLSAGYAVDLKKSKKLAVWLKKNGFEITSTSKDGTSIYAKGTVDVIQKALAVEMIRVTKDGITYTSARNAPSLPMEVGSDVHAIIGLQPFRQAHKNSRKFKKQLTTAYTPDSARKNASATSTAKKVTLPYMVKDIVKAYGADGIKYDGTGQTIAILIDTFPNDADMVQFWKRNKLKTKIGAIKKINVKGDPLSPPEGEESLDAQWTSGIAPAAKLRIYASGTLQFVDLDRALDRIIEDLPSQKGMRQLSISLGLGETYMGGPAGEVATQHLKFLKLAAAGVNVFVSSGDAGSNPGEDGHNPDGPTQVEYESSDPSVIGVGGTTLKLSSDGKVTNEYGWVSSGGGKSKFFKRPVWQKGSGIDSGTQRLVPDVSAVADPNTGGLVVLNGEEFQYGGTSWSAPIWAGICALLNQARKDAGKPLLPFLNPVLYPLIGTACFRDINVGDNGEYSAKAGHDMVTGIGVPNVKELAKALTI